MSDPIEAAAQPSDYVELKRRLTLYRTDKLGREAADAATIANAFDKALEALDGVLAIGPQSPGFGPETTKRVEKYRELVNG